MLAKHPVFACASLLLAGFAASCSGAKTTSAEDSKMRAGGQIATGPLPANLSFHEDTDLDGLALALSEVKVPGQKDAGDRAKVAQGEYLDDAKADAILRRVPALEVSASDQQSFALRQGSQPAPKTGKTVKEPFPVAENKAPPKVGKPGVLEVLRFAPEGEVPLAAHVSLTFSAPMVAVTSQEDAAKVVPASLSPTPKGSWRWLGTRTLLFKPDGRMPMATDYSIEVPAATKAPGGERLEKAVRFAFSTPPLGLVERFPVDGPVGLAPVIFLGFDQQVEPGKLVEFVALNAGKGYPVRLATKEEIAADETARAAAERAQAKRWLAVVPSAPLPKNTSFTVTLKKGAPSAEGPRRTPGDQAFSFRTYAPLAITQSRCGYDSNCAPNMDWTISFNNPLDQKRFDGATIQVSPEIPGLEINPFGSGFSISGLKQGRTRYTVTVPAALSDTFGQTLGKDTPVTFDVGPAEKTLFGPNRNLLTLDPTGPAALAVHTINHDKLKVEVRKVEPGLWPAFQEWMRKYHWEDAKPGPMPGKVAATTTVRTGGKPDQLKETLVDLKPYLDGGFGQLLLRIEPVPQPKERWNRQELILWIQVTRLGLAAFVDAKELLAWTTGLENGEPLKGALLALLPGGKVQGQSDGAGLSRLALTEAQSEQQLLVARRGKDVAFLPAGSGWWGTNGWSKVDEPRQMLWHTFDDRKMYRPGEEVRVKGWLRQFDPATNGNVGALSKLPVRIDWTLSDSRGNDLQKGTAKPSRLGGFHVALTLPKELNLGTAWLRFSAVGGDGVSNTTHSHAIEVQEFRRPEFEVVVNAARSAYVLGEQAVTDVRAAYYAGGGLPGAEVRWTATPSVASFIPPNRDDYSFGPWRPWWRSWNGGEGGETKHLEGKSDGGGEHHLGVRFAALNPPQPMSVRVEATVMDVNRQAWSSRKVLLVHPAEIYVGLKAKRGFVGQGEPINVDVLVVDLDGRAVPGVDIVVTAARMEGKWKLNKWSEEEHDPQTCSLTSAAEAGHCTFQPKVGGEYRVRAVIRDRFGRRNLTDTRVWMAGGKVAPSRDVEKQEVKLVPERREYQPGQTATFLVQAPFYPAQGLLTVRRSGLVRTESFKLEAATRTLSVPILEQHIPNVTVQIDLVGAAERTDDQGNPEPKLPRRVAYASGSLTFEVPPLQRALKVSATPAAVAIEPGGKTTLTLEIVDAAGRPVPDAEIAVAVADESVLALSGYELVDPLSVFYAARGAGVSDYHQREQVVLADPTKLEAKTVPGSAKGGPRNGGGGRMRSSARPMMLAMPSAAPAPPPMSEGFAKSEVAADTGSREEEDGDRPADKLMKKAKEQPVGGQDETTSTAAIAMRKNFAALALFAPEVPTDKHGRAVVALVLPDSLTRYRIMAVAVAGGKQFGKGESAITARLPLMVRPSAPRFLNFGDRFELPIVLQNQTDQAMTVDVAVRAANLGLGRTSELAFASAEKPGTLRLAKRVSVPANDRVEVRFPAAAAKAGTARLQVAAASGKWGDAAELELPVWTPSTTEAFATYGEIDQGALVQPVAVPRDSFTQFGGLEITTSSTQLAELTDAVLYLVSYPFDCSEQLASRLLSIAALKDVLAAFDAPGLPSKSEIGSFIAKDIDRLKKRQNWDGGFPFWRRGDASWPYLTIHVAVALALVKEKGFEVPSDMLQRTADHLRNIEQHIPAEYSLESKQYLRAFALHALERMGAPDAAKAKALLDEAGLVKLPLEADAFLLPTLAKAGEKELVDRILRHLGNRVEETAAAAHFTTNYSDGAHVLLHSDRRADGIILAALIDVQPKSDVIPKVVRGLLAHRTAGRWSSTQENAFVLIGLDRYFQTFEKITPDFVARVWLGGDFAGEHAFRGRTTKQARIDVPMAYLAKGKGKQNLVLSKDGAGRLYYRLGMRYAPRSLELAPADFGFAVQRSYEAVDDPADVRQDEKGVWHIKAGARVRVKLEMVAAARRYHVALVDPVPAGLEPVNPELTVSAMDQPQKPTRGSGKYWWWWWPWYEHQNMRDERVEAFTSQLWDGVYEYTYTARATTPGTFVVPPPKAEEMYHPETFGRGRTDRVIVE